MRVSHILVLWRALLKSLLLGEWIDFMLSSRIINSRLEECAVRRWVNKGTPHRGVESSLVCFFFFFDKWYIKRSGT